MRFSIREWCRLNVACCLACGVFPRQLSKNSKCTWGIPEERCSFRIAVPRITAGLPLSSRVCGRYGENRQYEGYFVTQIARTDMIKGTPVAVWPGHLSNSELILRHGKSSGLPRKDAFSRIYVIFGVFEFFSMNPVL